MSNVSREELGATALAMVRFIRTGERPAEVPKKSVMSVVRYHAHNISGLQYLARVLVKRPQTREEDL